MISFLPSMIFFWNLSILMYLTIIFSVFPAALWNVLNVFFDKLWPDRLFLDSDNDAMKKCFTFYLVHCFSRSNMLNGDSRSQETYRIYHIYITNDIYVSLIIYVYIYIFICIYIIMIQDRYSQLLCLKPNYSISPRNAGVWSTNSNTVKNPYINFDFPKT